MTLRRGFEVKPGDRAVVIEDVITTGGSTREVIRLLQRLGAEVVAAGSIIDRSGNTADVGVERVALQTMHPETYNPGDCPLCRQGLPVTKPGRGQPEIQSKACEDFAFRLLTTARSSTAGRYSPDCQRCKAFLRK